MEQNIIVTDEIGNIIGATYPRRAKGLIKKGRARIVDDAGCVICLACPPNNIFTEDTRMDEIRETEHIENTQADAFAYEAKAKAQIPLAAAAGSCGTAGSREATIESILNQIQKIHEDTQHITEGLRLLAEIPNHTSPGDPGSPGDLAGQAKARAIGDIVRGRQEANRRMIDLYEKVLNSLLPPPIAPEVPKVPEDPATRLALERIEDLAESGAINADNVVDYLFVALTGHKRGADFQKHFQLGFQPDGKFGDFMKGAAGFVYHSKDDTDKGPAKT